MTVHLPFLGVSAVFSLYFKPYVLISLFVLVLSVFLDHLYIPFSGRNPKLNLMLRGRPKILVLNKEDLCNPALKEVSVQWMEVGNAILAAITEFRFTLAFHAEIYV